MRGGRLTEARSFFRRAVAGDSTSYDAVAGSGMAAYRAGDLVAARRSFEKALQIVPRDSTALSYLARIPEPVAYVAPQKHVRPTTTIIAARTGKRIFEIPDAAGRWSPMWIKAVNLGAALPGKHPSEFPPNDSTYEKWIALIADMGANAVRVYTIHPPHFYAALRAWNLAHPSRPIWLICTRPRQRWISRRRLAVDPRLHHRPGVGTVFSSRLQRVPTDANELRRKIHDASGRKCA